MLREMLERDKIEEPEKDPKVFFYISPYRRSKETAAGIAQSFDPDMIIGVQKSRSCESRIRELSDGQMIKTKNERQAFGRFFYRFRMGRVARTCTIE